MTQARPVTPQEHAGPRDWPRLDARDTGRYGVFVRPDPATCRAQISLHTLLNSQYGLIAASAFPPHATLLGNIAITSGESELLRRVETVVRRYPAIEAHNRGLTRSGGAIIYDIHCRPDGSVNQPLTDLARHIERDLEQIRARTDHDYMTGHATNDAFHAHLTIAGQDLALREDLQAEIWQYACALAPDTPADFTIDTVSVYRFRSDHWASEWWKDMTWQHLRSFRLGPLHGPSSRSPRPSACDARARLRSYLVYAQCGRRMYGRPFRGTA